MFISFVRCIDYKVTEVCPWLWGCFLCKESSLSYFRTPTRCTFSKTLFHTACSTFCEHLWVMCAHRLRKSKFWLQSVICEPHTSNSSAAPFVLFVPVNIQAYSELARSASPAAEKWWVCLGGLWCAATNKFTASVVQPSRGLPFAWDALPFISC